MRLVSLLVFTAVTVGLVSAACAPAEAIVNAAGSTYNTQAYSQAKAVCLNSGATYPPATLSTPVNQLTYAMCFSNSNGICVDECVLLSQTLCMRTSGCMLVPGRSVLLNCVHESKLCGAITDPTLCASYGMCAWDSGRCNFSPPSNPTVAPGESVADKCAALHPVVIVMLVLMFLSFAGGVAVVAVVVVRNQRKADEEEARREQAAAAAAEAKRARNQRNKANAL